MCFDALLLTSKAVIVTVSFVGFSRRNVFSFNSCTKKQVD